MYNIVNYLIAMFYTNEVVHSVNIMIAILVGAVCYYIYYIFNYD